jgi:heat shock protein HspQ
MSSTHFAPGQLIHHKRFDYRGVIVDVDAEFGGTDDWYRDVALSRPPRNAPWYHVLVHGEEHSTYVAERNLEVDETGTPISHPLIHEYFNQFFEGQYRLILRN